MRLGLNTSLVCHQKPKPRFLHICPNCGENIHKVSGVTVHDLDRCALTRANKKELTEGEFIKVLRAYDPMHELKLIKKKKGKQ